MSGPLGYLCYLKGNKEQVIKYICCLVICIVLVCITKIIINSQISEMHYYDMEYQYVTVIHFKKWGNFDEESLEKIKSLEEVERLYPCSYSVSNCNSLFMSIDEKTYFVDQEYIKYLFEKMGVFCEIEELPSQDSGGAIVSHKLKKMKQYQLGDHISEYEKAPRCQLFLDYDQCISYVPTTIPKESLVYLVLHKQGKREEMNKKLKAFLGNEAAVYDLSHSKEVTKNIMREATDDFNIVMMLVTFITAMTAGIIMYVHYQGRRSEIALLSVLGYSPKWVIRRMMKEIMFSTCIATILASIILGIICFVCNRIVNEPNGYVWFIMDESILSLILTAALFMMAFSSIPIWLMLYQKGGVIIAEEGD